MSHVQPKDTIVRAPGMSSSSVPDLKAPAIGNSVHEDHGVAGVHVTSQAGDLLRRRMTVGGRFDDRFGPA